MMQQSELVDRVKSYDPGADEEALNRAYEFSMEAHSSQRRASGDAYFSHPLEVAGILTRLKLDGASIITGLLHDTVEDTIATLDDIEVQFGPDIARLVDGVTKLSQIELQSDHSQQAENFRKLVLAMSEDIRVLLVKLADRLHNMRTLSFIDDPAKRHRIAAETLDIYVPLTERIGIRDWKDELEDLAFPELNPEAHGSITKRLAFLRHRGTNIVEKVINELHETLVDAGVDVEVSGREKTPYSIWCKMQQRNIGFEQLSDIMAFRLVVDSVEDCYRTLGIIHAKYRVVPGRFKDNISLPKSNGYRSLHTGVIGPENQRIEIQIRTRAMHEIAEYGVAAHWRYKQGAGQVEGEQYRWLQELLEILEHASGPEEFLEHTKLEMFTDQAFCFSPKGDLYALPQNSTPVDFAYAVHSEIGDTCTGARVNGRVVPLRTKLINGDQVEITTSRDQTPSPMWLSFVVSGKARARVRRYVRSQQHEQYVRLGTQIAEQAFSRSGHDFNEKNLLNVLDEFHCESVDDLYALLGEGKVTGGDVVDLSEPGKRRKRRTPLSKKISEKVAKRDGHALSIRGLIPGMAVHFANCCHPLPGDRILGIVTTGKGVTVHTDDCETLESFTDMPERWLDVSWDEDATATGIYVGRVNIVLSNEPGVLGMICTVVGRDDGNISNLKITNRSPEFFELHLDIEVKNAGQLTDIVAALRVDPVVNSVERLRG